MDILIKVGQLILSLSILIVLHELGHFLPAKWFKTRVEKFYLFFDPYFELFKKKIGETEYGIGWLPLGGYVKISGMVDESFDTEQMKEPPQPWEFRSKPAWQRLIIMIGGVTVNFVLGFLIYSMIFFTWGEEYLPTKNAVNGVQPDSIGMVIGIQPGDHVVAVDTYQLARFNPGVVKSRVVIDGARSLTVERNGAQVKLPITDEVAEYLSLNKNKDVMLYSARRPFKVAGFGKGKCEGFLFWKKCEQAPAEKAGVQIGDQIIGLNGQPTPYFEDFYDKVLKDKQTNADIQLQVLRNADTLNLTVRTDENGKVGASISGDYSVFFKTEKQDYGFFESFPAGWKRVKSFLGSQFKAYGKMFSGDIKVTESLGSFISIGGMFSPVWDWHSFWNLTAMLSLVLAFINLLPIPALDGGHVMFLLFEVLTGKKPSDKFMEVATMVGFVILISLMVFALGLDISRLF
ncbi:MAG: RIP metalloprotease RseP [Saprospiraceae bacterium]|jgi:regulator of sigma E protease|nr:RIP metalloprotease RseP [Saprospiraceae bacterium]